MHDAPSGDGIRAATDIGGSFTDLVTVEDGRTRSVKRPSTPGDFAVGIDDAIAESRVDMRRVGYFAHGSTVVINALLERKGAVVGLVTTRGFRDVLEIARGNTPDMFNSYYRKPTPFVPRRLRQEVRERLDHRGDVVVPLDEDDVRRAAERLVRDGARAIAVCFLHAYANPAHERRALEIVAQAAPDVPAIASHQVCRQWREYERTSTAVLSAYVLPAARAYLERLQGNLARAGLGCKPLIMQSNGGLVGAATASADPISLVESGPAAGVLGAAAYGRMIGEDDLITLDIGGTTAKCSLIQGGAVHVATDYHIERTPVGAGYPISTPVVDIVEIGNGGGSIAWLDKAGALHVGPRSAGASPGPVAYGRGGSRPTTTDAHLLLGRIHPDKLAGGDGPPDVAAVRRAFAGLAAPLGVNALDAALGTVRIANGNMVNALKLVSVNRGHDPRDFSLIAFGGGAGLHAASLAQELEIPKVVIPPHSSVFSAWAMMTLDRRRDHIVTRIRRLDDDSLGWILDTFADIERTARQEFADDAAIAGEVEAQRHLDVRYAGQDHSVKIPFDPSRDDADGLRERFHAAHEREYTFRLDNPVEIVNLHLAVMSRPAGVAHQRQEASGDADAAAAMTGSRTVYFDADGSLAAAVFDRLRLRAGMAIVGPAVVEERDSVVLVPPSASATVDAYGGLHLRLQATTRR